jgi:hypothetical protein
VFSDPTQVTIAGVNNSLARKYLGTPQATAKAVSGATYGSSTGEVEMVIHHDQMISGNRRSTVMLYRHNLDSSPWDGSVPSLSNGVGLVFEVNSQRYNSTVDLADLRAAVIALVDSAFQARVVGGEI